MNLVSYEYIACQKDKHGVLVLSEFAGAAQSLDGSIIVNPWNTEELANAIYEAVTMPDDQRKSNHQKLSRYVDKHTAAYWGLSFVNELKRVSKVSDMHSTLSKLKSSLVKAKYQQSNKTKV